MSKLPTESEVIEHKLTLAEKNDAGADLCAFANKRGGTLYFGVKNNGVVIGLPGSVAEKTLRDLTQFYYDNLEPRTIMDIEHEVIDNKELIKIVVHRSSQPYHTFKGKPYIRVGPGSKQMSQDEYQRRLLLYMSTNKDYSSTLLNDAHARYISTIALAELRLRLKKSGRISMDINALDDVQLLTNLHLMQDGKFTLASIVLLGTEEALRKYLPYAEFRYGYKLEEGQIRNQDTEILTGGYLLYYNRIWEKINARNLTLNIPYGMQLIERKAFDEETIREAINNAVIHRDYTLSESTIIIQYQSRIEVRSPGGFPEGVTIANIIDETRPRNKLIADVLYKCELVEQFGNGVDLMVTKQLELGKTPPDFTGSDDAHVLLQLDGTIQDINFAQYVLAVAEKRHKQLHDRELLTLNDIKAGKTVKANDITRNLLGLGLIEQITPRRFMLAKQYYADTNQRSQYTRQRGLTKNKNKQLILQHLRDFGSGRKQDFREIFNPGLADTQINALLRELKQEELIALDGPPMSIYSSWHLTKKV